jgi:hypothetical protein
MHDWADFNGLSEALEAGDGSLFVKLAVLSTLHKRVPHVV